MARVYTMVVGKAEAGLRLDRYLVHHLPAVMSRAMIQRGIRDGRITVQRRAVKPNYAVRAEDVVSARIDELPARGTDTPLVAQPIPLEIVYEDEALLVVNKPPGLVTHPAPGHWDGTLVNAVLWHLQQAQGLGLRAEAQSARGSGCGAQHSTRPSPQPSAQSRPSTEPAAHSPEPILPRAGIVHRLDKDTSGLLLIAKTELAHAALSRQLKDRRITRHYVAVVEGLLPLNHGTVNVAIGRHQTHRKVMTVRHLGGRTAVTHYRVLKRFRVQGSGLRQDRLGAQGAGLSTQLGPALSPQPRAVLRPSPQPTAQNRSSPQPLASSPELSISYTVVDVSLETGRTHQIRVHMAHLGHPVLGDVIYGRHTAGVWAAVDVHRQLLHAYTLRFTHPMSGRPMALTAALPADLQRWVGDAADRVAA